MTFDEQYDARRNILRTNNRGGYSAVGSSAAEIHEFTTNRLTVWSPSGDHCYYTTFTPDQRSRPSSSFFTPGGLGGFSFDASDYVGSNNDQDSRYIPSDRWQSSVHFFRGNSVQRLTATWYASQALPGVDAVPIRIRVAGASWQLDPLTNRSIADSARVFSQ